MSSIMREIYSVIIIECPLPLREAGMQWAVAAAKAYMINSTSTDL